MSGDRVVLSRDPGVAAAIREVKARHSAVKPGDPQPSPPFPGEKVHLANRKVLHRLPTDLAHQMRMMAGPSMLEAAIYDEHPTIALAGGRRGMRLVVSRNLAPEHGGQLLQVSISYPASLPSWREVTMVKDAIFGNIDACMILPRQEDYVNVNRWTLQLVQLPWVWGYR
jgi:hypothetical protein